MKFTFLTLFPELISPYFGASILKRAIEKNKFSYECLNPRNFSEDKYKKVDDYMIGGGAGMLIKPDVLGKALDFVLNKTPQNHIIFLSPVGKKFNQKDAKRLSKFDNLCFVCGRYEGFDERVIEIYADEIFSIGDFILTGGEIASLVMCDAVARNIQGVLGNSDSLNDESFENEILEAPSFTKPDTFKNYSIISEFLKGNHSKITALKNSMAVAKTRFFRPDLYRKTPKIKEIL